MKRIILLLLGFYPFVLFSQPAEGDGSFGNPYRGAVTTPWSFSGDYYYGDLTVSSGILTIDAEAILRFGTGNSLTISGTGALSSVGNSSSYITFTSSGASWGHIVFDVSGTEFSSIEFCIIQNGSVSGTGYAGAGGGILIRHSNVTVSNSIIRNNSADWGGGIFIDDGENPYINNCLFKNNQSLHAGGGIYCWNSVSSEIENCIFESNSCLEPSTSYYTGGGLAAQSGCSIKLLNCTFINNTSLRTEGQALLLQNSGTSKVINSIFWGSSDKQIYCYNTSAGTLINCAYRGITYSSGTPVNPVILNSANSASDGPNFSNPGNFDWSLMYISPCRDAGVDTYSEVTIPLTDYAGNSRVRTTDIGSFEVQYSRWKTNLFSTDWNTDSNWDGGLPSISRDIIIPTGATSYPVDSPGPDFTIGSGKLMIIESGARVTLDDLTNEGILKLNHNASGFASLILKSYTRENGGSEEIQLYLTGGGGEGTYKWHYISTPVSSLSTNVFTGVTLNLAQFYEDRPTFFTLMSGWIAFDGYEYHTRSFTDTTFSFLTPGKGYNYYDSSDNLFTFNGLLNTSNVNVTLAFTGQAEIHGFNLLGNPFSSGLDWDEIVNSTSFTYPTSTSKAVYFTQDNVQCTYIAGLGSPAGVTGIIPPMQGFFTKTYSPGNSITLAAAARTNDTIHARYKGKTIIPLVRLQLSKDTVNYDETVVRFDELAKTTLDNDFDALKMFISDTINQIYTSLSGTDYSINGQPFPLESSPEVPSVIEIPVVVNVIATGNYKISAIQLQGIDPTTYDVTLLDNTTGFPADLKTTPEVLFSSDAGTFTDRFKLFVSLATGIEKPESSKSIFNIYPHNGMINVVPLADDWSGKYGSINILDITGKYTGNLESVEFQKNTIVQLEAPEVKGLYFVEVRSGVRRYVGKVIIK